MKINRIWAMPNKWTFKIKPIEALLYKYVGDGKGWVDPFANDNSPAQFTNDINPDTKAKSHLDAYEFLQTFDDNSMGGVLLDPPYSFHQATKTYNNKKLIVLTPIYQEVRRILKPNGLVIHFGWNSNGIGAKNGFDIKELLIIPHGGHHNDTIVTVEQKTQGKLF